MTQERFTQLPNVTTSELTDIICAVQGFVSEPSQLGLSTQQTLGQIFNLFKSNMVLSYAGNPNGFVAGNTFQLCWDTVNHILYVCTVTGSSSLAVWDKSIQLTAGSGITISQSGNNIVISSTGGGGGITWNDVTGTAVPMISFNGYKANNAARVTLTLPVTSSFGDVIEILGLGAGGWSIAQNAGQRLIVGATLSTIGVMGSVSSTNRYDSIELRCLEDNFTWECLGGPQGNLNII